MGEATEDLTGVTSVCMNKALQCFPAALLLQIQHFGELILMHTAPLKARLEKRLPLLPCLSEDSVTDHRAAMGLGMDPLDYKTSGQC